MSDLLDQLLAEDDSAARMERLQSAPDLHAVYEALLHRARSGVVSAAPDALTAAQAATEAAALLKQPREEAAARRVAGQALRVVGRHPEALEALEAAAEAARRADDPLLAAQVRIGQIDSLGWLGRVDEAGRLAETLESEFRDLGADAEAAKVLVNRGNLAFRTDEYVRALDFYERAGAMLEGAGDEVAVARVQASRANILTHLNRVEEAISLFRTAGEAFSAHSMVQEVAMGEGNIAYLETMSGRLTSALSSFQKARQIFEDRGQEIEAAKADLDIAEIYRLLNLLPEALEHYERTALVFARRELPYEHARATMGQGAALAGLGRTDDALEALATADRLFRSQKNRLQLAHLNLVRAELMRQSGYTSEARRLAGSAERAFRRSGLPGWAAEARYTRIRIDMEGGTASPRGMAAVVRAARAHGRGWLECRAEESLARWYQERGKEAAAILHYRRGVQALERIRTQVVPEEMHVAFLRDKLGVYDGLITLLLSRGRPRDIREALEQVERARSRLLLERLESALDGRAGKAGAAPTEAETRLRERIARLRAELNRVYHQVHSFDEGGPQRLLARPEPPGAAAERLLELEADYARLLRELDVARGATERSLPTGTGVDLLQDALDPDETLVEFYAGEGVISAFLVTRARTAVCHPLGAIAPVSQAARRLRYHLQRIAIAHGFAGRHGEALNAGIAEVTACLYELLWRPIERLIRTEKVTIVPHGLLHGLPIHALGGPRCAVLDRWEIAYTPSAAFRCMAPERRAAASGEQQAPALLVGVPGPGIEQVGSEIDELRELLPGARTLRDGEATLASFRRFAPASRVLHLATHALYRADNPLFSGLRFADGWLLARDLYDLRLDCDLATLSACQTGVAHVAPGDELFGLLRGFLAAGARSVAASFWPADDTATAALMGRLYRGIAAGLPSSAALRIAQREVRKEWPHPYYWAPFALIGER